MPIDWNLPCAAPRFATARNLELPTDGRAAGRLARFMGIEAKVTGARGLIPAQQYIADVAGERLADGAYRYPIIFVTIMRQAGKTVLGRISQTTRGVKYPDQKIRYTAQTGQRARDRWLDNVKAVKASPLGPRTRVSYAAGASLLTFPNGSTIGPFAPTSTSVHSETLNRVDIDEVWSFDQVAGDELIAAIKPAQLTVRDRQIWLYSAANRHAQHESEFMRAWMLIGRSAVLDPAARVAYFEWSFPDDADSYDPAIWRAHHPGIGHLITEDDIADAVTSFTNRLDFDLAYGNRWPKTIGTSPINIETFAGRADRSLELPADPGRITLAFDVGPDRSEAAILASWVDPFGRPAIKLLEHGPDAAWLLDRIPELNARLAPAAIAADSRGECRSITAKLRLEPHELDIFELPTTDYITACGAFLLDATVGALVHDGAEPLLVAVRGAQTKTIGDAWVWDARASDRVTPLRAATVARWVTDHPPDRPAPIPRAEAVFG